MNEARLTSSAAARFAALALECIGREYPNFPQTLLVDETDVRPPRENTPAFFGCFDWHSAVHGHWTLVRLIRCLPGQLWSDEARMALRCSLTAENLAAEVRHISRPGREGFERPYGLAWLLQLAAELREWNDPDGDAFARAIAPLEILCRNRLADWLPKLTDPIRSGEHSQTAFAMGLAFDWAVAAGDDAFAGLLRERAIDFYADDRNLLLMFEPSGHDFLSPALAEADLIRRVMPASDFTAWISQSLPTLIDSAGLHLPLAPVASTDQADGKLAHLDGLNLSRAWMLEGVASALPPDSTARSALVALANEHARAGLTAVTGEHYAGGHWLGTFATYLLTRRGITRSLE